MKRQLIRFAVPMITLALTGCIDNGYDLSDIDTTTEIAITDLILPVNIDNVKLSDVIDIDRYSKIKIMEISGKKAYVITDHGTFSSDPIIIPSFSASAPDVTPVIAEFSAQTPAGSNSGNGNSSSAKYSLLSPTSQSLNFKADRVSDAIVRIGSISCEPMTLNITFETKGSGQSGNIRLDNVAFSMMKHLTLGQLPQGYAYNPTTGILTIKSIDFGTSRSSTVSLEITAIGFDSSNLRYDRNLHTLAYDTRISLAGATLSVSEGGSTLPDNISMTVGVSAGEIKATSFSGELNYIFTGKGLDISPIDLSDFPSFLSESGTDLKLSNPQVYLSVNNPVWKYYMNCSTRLKLSAVRNNSTRIFIPDNDATITLGYALEADNYNFILAPTQPSQSMIPPEYSRMPQYFPFTDIKDILSGNRIPDSIYVELIDPQVPLQKVENFALGIELEPMRGTYEFQAPLSLVNGEDGSVIIYHTSRSGWDDQIAKMTLDTIEVEADIDSTVPLGGTLTAVPIDSKGNRMDVTLEGAEFDAKAFNQHITVRSTGVIRDLNGMAFEAVVRPGNRSEALGPEQSIVLKNVKVKVNGSYSADL